MGYESEIKPQTPPFPAQRASLPPSLMCTPLLWMVSLHIFLEVFAIFSGLFLIQHPFCCCFEHVLKCQKNLFGKNKLPLGMSGEQGTETLWQASSRQIEKAAMAIFSVTNLISSHICFLVQYSPQE